MADPSWVRLACEQLRKHRYARLRLTSVEAELAHRLYDAASSFFDDDAKHDLEIPEEEYRQYDSRSGFVPSRRRELFELHRPAPKELRAPAGSTGAKVIQVSDAFEGMCRARCDQALQELAASSPQLASLIEKETEAAHQQLSPATAASSPATTTTELAAMEPSGFVNSMSMLRVYRYKEAYYFEDGDAHHDMGLLTLIVRGTRPGLEIQPDESDSKSWRAIEEAMAPDEAILFGGLTLARLTGIAALRHRIFTDNRVRMSAPFFQRASPHVWLDAEPGLHEAETVARYSERIRDARDDEVCANGVVRLRRRTYDRGSCSPSPRSHRGGGQRCDSRERGGSRGQHDSDDSRRGWSDERRRDRTDSNWRGQEQAASYFDGDHRYRSRNDGDRWQAARSRSDGDRWHAAR